MRLLFKSEDNSLNNRSLSGEVIFAGHEPTRCQLLLDESRWPMVARLHAEFRIVNGICHVFALDPDAGTYIEGERITQPAPVRAGSRIQFGEGGPQVTLLHVETLDSTSPPAVFPVARSRLVGSRPAADENRRPHVRPASVEVADNYVANVHRLDISKDVVRVGRAPELDVVFDAASCFVSRLHAEITRTANGYVLTDLNSFNGTLLNRQRITGPSFLRDGDIIQLGVRGPILHFRQAGISLTPPTPSHADDDHQGEGAAHGTRPGRGGAPVAPPSDMSRHEPLYVLPFDGRTTYLIGRASDSYVKLDGFQISQRHAALTVVGKHIFVEDSRSTNGSFVNGLRLMGRMEVCPSDVIQIGPFFLRVALRRGIEVYDTRAQMRIDCIGLTRIEKSADPPKLLDDISLTIHPNEFVGLLGPSGAGKTTLMKALNGMRRATSGRVLVNNHLDLYQNLNWLKQSIGYVPQDDIIHRELTVYRTLYYVARLRLSDDVSEADISQNIDEVLDVTGLAERRNVKVSELSGGQRKRVSVAVELLTKPSVIFLDEPTSGLDPVAEEKIMRLFRRIADSGHTVVLTTHNMESVKLFDKVVILMRGKLVFYGTPAEALSHVNAVSFKELYDRLEEPIARRTAGLPPPGGAQQQSDRERRLAQARERVAEMWKSRFRQTAQYERNVRRPQSRLPSLKAARVRPRRRPTFRHGLKQWGVLCRRYGEILRRDTFNLWILFTQAPVIAVLTWLAVAPERQRDFPYFILSLVPLWFGTSIAAREIVRERAVYRRERMVNLGILPYVGSKLGVLSLVVSLQCLLLFGTLKLFTLCKLFTLPGLFGGLPQLLTMILTGVVGIALGLLVSAWAKSSEFATSFVPLLLIPQILFCGLTGVPKGMTKVVGAAMPATWSFDQMKRLSAREVEVMLGKDEGAEPAYNNEGRGLFKQLERENEHLMEEKEKEINDYKARQEERLKHFRQETEEALKMKKAGQRRPPAEIEVEPTPAKKTAVKSLPYDLSDYVEFLHPWGSKWLNPVILMVMFLSFVTATACVLRRQDVT